LAALVEPAAPVRTGDTKDLGHEHIEELRDASQADDSHERVCVCGDDVNHRHRRSESTHDGADTVWHRHTDTVGHDRADPIGHDHADTARNDYADAGNDPDHAVNDTVASGVAALHPCRSGNRNGDTTKKHRHWHRDEHDQRGHDEHDTVAVHAKRHDGSWVHDAGRTDHWRGDGGIDDARWRHHHTGHHDEREWRIVTADPVPSWSDDGSTYRRCELAVGRVADDAQFRPVTNTVVSAFSRLLKKTDQPEGREQMAKGIVAKRFSAAC
jgi:hypothetical protein